MKLAVLLRCSPQPDHLPPEASRAQPDEDVHNGDNEPIAPPLSQRDIPSAIEDRGRTDPIVGEATHKVWEEWENHGGKEWGGAQGTRHWQERGEHCSDVCSATGEEIVGVEVQQHQDAERKLPGQTKASNKLWETQSCGQYRTNQKENEKKYILFDNVDINLGLPKNELMGMSGSKMALKFSATKRMGTLLHASIIFIIFMLMDTSLPLILKSKLARAKRIISTSDLLLFKQKFFIA